MLMSNLFLCAIELKGIYALAAALAIGLAALGGAIAMGMAIGKALDAIARQPEADNKIRTSLILGLVFIETALLYATLISLLIVINVL